MAIIPHKVTEYSLQSDFWLRIHFAPRGPMKAKRPRTVLVRQLAVKV